MQRRIHGGHARAAGAELSGYGIWYLVLGFVLVMGLSCGWALPMFAEDGERAEMARQALQLVPGAVQSGRPFWAMLCAGVFNAGRMVLLLFIAGLSPYLSVCAYAALFAKGFAIGFTMKSLFLAHGAGGLCMAAVMLVLQNALYVPAYAYMAAHPATPKGALRYMGLWQKVRMFISAHRAALLAVLMGVLVECILTPLITRAVYGWIF